MSGKTFDQIAKEQFGFLVLGYGFNLRECRRENWGCILLYLNRTTGVEIAYEYREAYVFITLYQLVRGRLIRNPRVIVDDTKIRGFDLDDIIDLRNPSARIKPAYEYGDDSEYHDKETGMTLYVSRVADNLRKHAGDVLSGDFTVFGELDRVVKKRAKSLRHPS